MLTDADMLTYDDVIAGEEAYMHDLRLEGQQRARTIPTDMPAAAAAACNDWREVLSLLSLLVQKCVLY
jgi:hypothetical protein